VSSRGCKKFKIVLISFIDDIPEVIRHGAGDIDIFE
jgi:hypothetical protein